MLLSKSFDCKGLWWLPNEKVARGGILTYSPTKGIYLEVFGSLNESGFNRSQLLKEFQTIEGNSHQYQSITLIGCLCLGVKISTNTTLQIERYKCKGIIIGSHHYSIDLDTPLFNSVTISSPHLTAWMDSTKEPVRKLLDEGFSYEEGIIQTCTLADNMQVSFQKCYIRHADQIKFQITPQVQLTLSSNHGICLNQIYYYIERFADLLSLICLGTPAIETIHIKEKDESSNIHIAHYLPDRLPYAKSVKKLPYLLFHYKDLQKYGLSLQELLDQWFNIDKDIEPIREHLINSINLRSQFSTIDFQTITYALEGFYHRFRGHNDKREKLKDRIKALKDEFENIECISLANINPKAIADTRNYYSHFYFRPNDIIYEGVELIDQTLILRKLLMCCVLRLIGFTYEAINIIMKQNIDLRITANQAIDE